MPSTFKHPASPVTAVLGPTNTGKTHLAVERMLAHAGGMIGLPLRLLAREIYDRVRLKAGDHAVALITGEEKIIPAQPRYWVCTVEAMPPDLRVPFLAIDEVQLAGDFERGHIFTDRILNRRGLEETMLLGSGTMRPILEKLIPGTTFISRPRFSKLTYAGPRKLSRLPRRSAIVAFTAEMVYTVAEMIRRQRGGAAVVMGALSPRTRNAQVALYQSGEVDYLVATDAIGMGLNMDVDHVAFASTRKFDGFQYRQLTPSELGQIAGRAGRYMNDGTFGVTAEADAFEPEIIDRLENHNFESLRVLQWRNRELDFRSLDGLRKSLGTLPNREGLTRAQPNPDIEALEAVCRDPNTNELPRSAFEVERAWEVCQIPDYRNISPAEHAHLVSRVLGFLHTRKGVIDEDWFSKQLAFCENLEGNIDSLSQRISHVRTWTFIANRADWLEAPTYWQRRAREIEDRLSDVLHEKLTQRFIDRRTSVLMRRLAKKEGLMSSVEEDGAISVEGEVIGRIVGLSFVAGEALDGGESRLLKQAAVQALTAEVTARAISLATTADTELRLSRQGDIVWQGQPIGKLHGGDARFKPRVEVIADDLLAPALREDVRQRLQKFVDRTIASAIEPLLKLEEAEGLENTTRGLAYRLAENFGVLPREDVTAEVKALTQEDRAKLRGFGVRFGAHTIFLPALLKPAPTEIRMLLWWLEQLKATTVTGLVPTLPPNGLTSMTADTAMPQGFYRMGGYRISGKRAVRVDMLERLADMIRDRLFWKPRIPEEVRPVGSFEGGGFTVIPDMMSVVGCSGEDFQDILASLGYRSQNRQVAKPVQVPPVKLEVVESNPEAVESPPEPEAAVESTSESLEVPVEVETAAVPPPEMLDVTVWWPKDMGPFKTRPPRPEKVKFEKPKFDKPKFDKASDAKPYKKRFEKPERQSAPERPKRPEKPLDPNSPFAALAALRASMGKGNG
jgi:ATP-dependent RNA helicase SUPV3L1/SUV3